MGATLRRQGWLDTEAGAPERLAGENGADMPHFPRKDSPGVGTGSKETLMDFPLAGMLTA
jgi:hypothetical protein